ncbi:HAD family hydrolase [Flexivirga sp. ID2601S]|uniref:HAD family hydrolase n=1 Tax=Flexivirga aerilata TaxID=1656889 RepID=A0A849AFI1_9MICO|nr:HAD family hydrolase [Flexivirga aerilata]NNG38336.1 HAD family hydrolase [Flexivirga aerilata]
MTTPSRPPAVSAVSLDIWGTLLGSDPAFKPARNAMLRDALAPDVATDVFDAAMRQADRDVDDRVVVDGVDVGFAGRVEQTLLRLGMTAAAVAERAPELMARQETLALAHPPRPLVPGLPAAVSALPVPVVLTSNTGMLPGELMRKLLALAGFGGLPGVFSNEVGVAKPRPEIFAEACSTLGVPASQVLHVGDNPIADVHGAEAAGMSAALVRPDGESTLDALRGIA